MISILLCSWCLRRIVSLFGMEVFAVSAVYSLPEPVLIVLDEYLKEVPA